MCVAVLVVFDGQLGTSLAISSLTTFISWKLMASKASFLLICCFEASGGPTPQADNLYFPCYWSLAVQPSGRYFVLPRPLKMSGGPTHRQISCTSHATGVWRSNPQADILYYPCHRRCLAVQPSGRYLVLPIPLKVSGGPTPRQISCTSDATGVWRSNPKADILYFPCY